MFPLIGDTGPEATTPVPAPSALPGADAGTITASRVHHTDSTQPALVRLATEAEAIIALECGVGETLFDETVLMRVYGAGRRCQSER